MECEVCGQNYPPENLHYVKIEGAVLRACPRCSRKGTPASPPPRPLIARGPVSAARPRPKPVAVKSQSSEAVLEVVADYANRIREARDGLGWTQQFLAHKLSERESYVKNMEAGRMAPSMDIAKRIEKLLNIRLLERPRPEELEPKLEKGGELTLGDVVDLK